MIRFIVLALAALSFMARPALASEWVVDYSASHLGFQAQQEGEWFRGDFLGFSADISFDEATPEKGRITATIPLGKVKVEGKDRQDAIIEQEWFDIKRFPTARFTSTRIRTNPKGGFIAEGELTLKGITKNVSLPFTLLTNAGVTTAHGSLTLNRSDFKVGTGDYATDEWIGFDVRVDVMIVAKKK